MEIADLSQSLRKSGLCRLEGGQHETMERIITSQSLRKSGLCRPEKSIKYLNKLCRNPFVNQVFVVAGHKRYMPP